MTAMTPDKVEAALAYFRNIDAVGASRRHEHLSVLTEALAERERDAELGREIATVFLPVMEAMRPLVLNLERLKDAAMKETP